jgi:hypothetical protein
MQPNVADFDHVASTHEPNVTKRTRNISTAAKSKCCHGVNEEHSIYPDKTVNEIDHKVACREQNGNALGKFIFIVAMK